MHLVKLARDVSDRMQILVEGLTEEEIDERVNTDHDGSLLEDLLHRIERNLTHDIKMP